MTKILSIEEIEAILKRVRPLPSSYYWSAVIGIMAYAGLREIEVIELLSEDVDLEGGFINVSSSENADEHRQIQISGQLLPLLERKASNTSKYYFPNIQANGKKWYESSFEKELKKRLPQALEPINLSDSFGTF